jgi:hypothetical protein
MQAWFCCNVNVQVPCMAVGLVVVSTGRMVRGRRVWDAHGVIRRERRRMVCRLVGYGIFIVASVVVGECYEHR